MKSINCKRKMLDFSSPMVMGILNITPDSFYDGGRFKGNDHVLSVVAQMLNDGAAMIDVGGMSSRPGANLISIEEELSRVVPVVQSIVKEFPNCILSVDTLRSEVAEVALMEGASIINDISAGTFDERMFHVVARYQAPYIIMHMKGMPKNMQNSPAYQNVTNEIFDFLLQQRIKCINSGINDVIIDVGFGFGKTLEDNFTLLKKLNVFKLIDAPLLVGLSRKSMVSKALDTTAEHALNGTSILNFFALEQGASILRVHDVKDAFQAIKLYETLNKAS